MFSAFEGCCEICRAPFFLQMLQPSVIGQVWMECRLLLPGWKIDFRRKFVAFNWICKKVSFVLFLV